MKPSYAFELAICVYLFGFSVTLAMWFLMILGTVAIRDLIKVWKKAGEVNYEV